MNVHYGFAGMQLSYIRFKLFLLRRTDV